MSDPSASFGHHHHSQKMHLGILLFYYFFFGAIHELSHVVTYLLLTPSQEVSLFQDGIGNFLFQTFVLRQCHLPLLQDKDDEAAIVRHTGWICSIIILCLCVFCRSGRNKSLSNKNEDNQNATIAVASLLTALEALSTDLFGLVPTALFSSSSNNMIFFCGNFGIIMIHQAWFGNQTGTSTALDILEKMVQVTMMRGAQSGGVVAYPADSQKAIRSRVVNAKRTDLSKKVRHKLQRDLSSSGDVPFFAGHTRFATSSKATLSGTHPQRWTPPSSRRVYDLNVVHTNNAGSSKTKRLSITGSTKTKKNHLFEPRLIRVENYITHNGDFEFYQFGGRTYDLETIQQYLANVLDCPMPAVVDSCAVAGMIDLLRTQGCFGLSARYAIFGTKFPDSATCSFPSYTDFEKIGLLFEEVLGEMQKANIPFEQIKNETETRQSFAVRVLSKLERRKHTDMKPLQDYLIDDGKDEENIDAGSITTLSSFCLQTVHAFFDNDLFFATQTFIKNAKGSFGLCVTSSLDGKRQLVLAARGQTMSIAFYPNKGLICYGSEQAAVKAGLNFDFPSQGDIDNYSLGKSRGDIDDDALRLDLDDLNGEVLVLDWGAAKGYQNPPVSRPNQHLFQHELMNGAVHAIIHHESKASGDVHQLFHRMTRLTRNRLISPLRPDLPDPVLNDIQDIPKICHSIQNEWKVDQAAKSLNRLTAYNLSRCLRQRLEAHIAGTVHPKAIDILLTGCEVSLWLAEQFASDLQKAFPNLCIKALSSNKLLGLYGQEITVPSFGFMDAPETHHLNDTIIIIVSHSGGTFAPLSCSNLLQSKTRNLFVITSEWDTQIGKQLRAMDALDSADGNGEVHIFNSRIFSTEVGIRPAEPCSISVVATHQLLTNLFSYICVILLSDARFRQYTNPTISEYDLQVLEKCNEKNIDALSEIASANLSGEPFVGEASRTNLELRKAGDLWAEHILENARAYIISFFYIFGTVVSGYPMIYGFAVLAGFNASDDWIYLIRLLDAAIYFWMPQINIMILRLIQRRNLRHRMVGRTVVIGDIPWVAQAAEAFLSKLFACSYSIAGLNVLSGNPADHFVHRHTHRVVRGSLVICGRPDGRLSALSTAEASVSLSINQASSIQSLGGTCESITIGHNPFKLPLTQNAIFLRRKRPLFLCERFLVENDYKEEKSQHEANRAILTNPLNSFATNDGQARKFWHLNSFRRKKRVVLDSSSHHNCSVRPAITKRRSAAALIGAYMNFDDIAKSNSAAMECLEEENLTVDNIIKEVIEDRKWSDNARKLFASFDTDKNGFISLEEFMNNAEKLNSNFSEEELQKFFNFADADGSMQLDYEEFLRALKAYDLQSGIRIPAANRNEKGLIEIEASQEKYFGETLRKVNAGKSKRDVDFLLARKQHFSQELYETRIASLQRFVAMTVMFHQIGKRVQEFFRKISFGILGYRMDRTHSIMRIATTASPISGADVRQRMRHLQLLKKVQHSVHVIATAYINYKKRSEKVN